MNSGERTADGAAKIRKSKKRNSNYFDYGLLFVWIFIMLFGFVLLYSASSYTAVSSGKPSTYFLQRQILATVIGCAAMLVTIRLDYRFWRMLSKYIYFFALFTVALVKSPLGIESHGAKRWVGVGPAQFQPAELVKVGVIMMTAYMLSKCGQNALKSVKTCYQIFFVSILGAAFVVGLTSNMSSALIIAAIGAVMILIAGACKKFVISIPFVGAFGVAAILIISGLMGKGFRSSRIIVWLNPEAHASDGGYQIMQGLYAIGSGGLFGKGLGNSSQKLGFVPEPNNDMIFSIICEELGIFGALCIILLFIFMIWRMRIIASNAPDLYGSMLVVGVMAHISVQVVLNIAVVTNSIPNTGVSLPFISYGGTSLAFLIFEMGIVLSVSRRIKRIR